ncbi:hypothetical protein ACOTDE_25805 [Achromobacter xylosoxidans]
MQEEVGQQQPVGWVQRDAAGQVVEQQIELARADGQGVQSASPGQARQVVLGLARIALRPAWQRRCGGCVVRERSLEAIEFAQQRIGGVMQRLGIARRIQRNAETRAEFRGNAADQACAQPCIEAATQQRFALRIVKAGGRR